MGQHREKSARLEDKCAWMREQQRLKQEAAKAGAVAQREARRTGAVTVKPAPAQKTPAVVGYTWGKPLPRRTRDEMKRAWRKHKREKKGSEIS